MSWSDSSSLNSRKGTRRVSRRRLMKYLAPFVNSDSWRVPWYMQAPKTCHLYQSSSGTELTDWHIQSQVDPRRWGRFGFGFLYGMSYYVDRMGNPVLLDAALTILQLQPKFLMCRICAGHFHLQVQHRPLPTVNQQIRLFPWVYDCSIAIAERSWRSHELSWTQLWLQERWTTFDNCASYWKKRMFGGLDFFQLWCVDAFVFLTLLIRCCSPRSQWTRGERIDILTYLFNVGRLFNIPLSIIEQFDTVQDDKEWSGIWWNAVAHVLGAESATTTIQLALTAFPLHPISAGTATALH
jgi:hypothetical protein